MLQRVHGERRRPDVTGLEGWPRQIVEPLAVGPGSSTNDGPRNRCIHPRQIFPPRRQLAIDGNPSHRPALIALTATITTLRVMPHHVQRGLTVA